MDRIVTTLKELFNKYQESKPDSQIALLQHRNTPYASGYLLAQLKLKLLFSAAALRFNVTDYIRYNNQTIMKNHHEQHT